jgi:uncharacterized protein
MVQAESERVMETVPSYSAFAGDRLIASGDVRSMLARTKAFLDRGGDERILIFSDQSGAQIEFDLEGTLDEVLAKAAADATLGPAVAASVLPPRPGRPKLGVVCREVSLLPRHWQWLDRQPSGTSATLRRLIEVASKSGRSKELAREAREAAAKFMWAMAGNLSGFEEASRALYAKDQERFEALIRDWPEDIRKHALRLVGEAARLDALAMESVSATAPS